MAQGQLEPLIRHLRKLAGAGEFEELTDGELLSLFVTRQDEGAFAALLERQGPMVLGVCRRVLHCHQDAEDAFQAVFLVLIRQAASIGKRESVAGWLYRVAYRVAMKAKISAARRGARENRAGPTANPETPPDTEVLWRELGPILDEELNQLPEKYRAPLVLCYFEGKTYTQAARELGWTRGTLSGRMAQARDLLRNRLSRRGITLTAGLLGGLLSPGVTSAAVPPLLMNATYRALVQLAAGTVRASLISPQVSALAESVIRAMVFGKVKIACVLAAALILLAITGSWVLRPGLVAQPAMPTQHQPGQPPARGQARAPKKKQPRTDLFRDPLPPQAVSRMGTVRWRHGLAMKTVAVASHGRRIASLGFDHVVRFWEPATGKETCRFPAKPNHEAIGAIALSSDGKMLAAAGTAIHLVDPATGKELRTCGPVRNPVLSVTFSPDGNTLASVHRDRTLHFWNTASGAEADPGFRAQADVCSVAFSPTGKILAAGQRSGALRLWDLAAGNRVQEFAGHGGPVKALAFSSGGQMLASAGGDGTVRVGEVAGGRVLHRFANVPDGVDLSLGFSADGKWLAFANGPPMKGTAALRVWNLATGREQWPFAEHPLQGYSAAFSADGTRLLCAGGDGYMIRFWDMARGEEQRLGRWHQAQVMSVAFAPDGKMLATGSWDRTVRLWEAATGRELHRLEHPRAVIAVAFSPRGRLLASAGDDRRVYLWNPATGQEVGRLDGRQQWMHALAFSPDGKTLVAGGSTIRRWQVAAGKELPPLPEPYGRVYSVAFSPDSKTLASGHEDHQVRLWDMSTAKLVRTLAGGQDIVPSIQFSPSGKHLAAAGFDEVVRLWDVRTGKEIRQFVRDPKDDNGIRNRCCLAFSPDGKTLATGSWDWRIRLYDLATGKERPRLAGRHQGSILSLAFSPDGKRLASASQDTTVLVWDIAH
jgi:RNA polymerase sigma factor (sigma-70 family)